MLQIHNYYRLYIDVLKYIANICNNLSELLTESSWVFVARVIGLIRIIFRTPITEKICYKN